MYNIYIHTLALVCKLSTERRTTADQMAMIINIIQINTHLDSDILCFIIYMLFFLAGIVNCWSGFTYKGNYETYFRRRPQRMQL